MFACGKCGAQYLIQHPTQDSGKKDRLYYKGPQYAETGKDPAFIDSDYEDEEAEFEGADGYPCKFCGERGSYIFWGKLFKKIKCPQCGNKMSETDSWVT
jgi:hypothetical protein